MLVHYRRSWLGGGVYAYQVHNNIQAGMDPWQAMYYENINWKFVGAGAAVGAVIAPVLYLGYLCVMSSGLCVVAWEIADYYDDMATMAAAAQGDPEAVGQMGLMAQLQLWPDLPVNFLFSKADDVADAVKYVDEVEEVVGLADDVGEVARYVDDTEEALHFVRSRGEPFAFGQGERSERAQNLMEEVAKIAGVPLNKYVDNVYYNPNLDAPYFDVDPFTGERFVVINSETFGKTRAGQLIAASHEFAHAEIFDWITHNAYGGNRFNARFYYFDEFQLHMPMGETLTAVDEIMVEMIAIQRVSQYLGGLSPQQIGHSTRYIDSYLQ